MKEDDRQRPIDAIAESLSQVSRQDVISRALEHFRKAGAEYRKRLADAVARRRR
jgi:catalase